MVVGIQWVGSEVSTGGLNLFSKKIWEVGPWNVPSAPPDCCKKQTGLFLQVHSYGCWGQQKNGVKHLFPFSRIVWNETCHQSPWNMFWLSRINSASRNSWGHRWRWCNSSQVNQSSCNRCNFIQSLLQMCPTLTVNKCYSNIDTVLSYLCFLNIVMMEEKMNVRRTAVTV